MERHRGAEARVLALLATLLVHFFIIIIIIIMITTINNHIITSNIIVMIIIILMIIIIIVITPILALPATLPVPGDSACARRQSLRSSVRPTNDMTIQIIIMIMIILIMKNNDNICHDNSHTNSDILY